MAVFLFEGAVVASREDAERSSVQPSGAVSSFREGSVSPRQHAVVEVAKALYWLDSGREPTDEQALSEWGNRARAAVETMQRLGWHL